MTRHDGILPSLCLFVTIRLVILDESVRKQLLFVAVILIAMVVSLGWNRVKAFETFLPTFSNGKELGHVDMTHADQNLIYKVQRGDAWWTIARDHNVSTRALLEANGANVGIELVAGQNIRLPGSTVPVASASAKAF